MAIQNFSTKTTLESQIVSGNHSVCNMYATVESTGAFTINFNVIDSEGWFENEASNNEDAKALLANVQQVAHNQHEASKVAGTVE
ncbi:hypothetical protein [Lactococcus lactis]|uniref:hypothetical protein n=1 Tax=Lactococcus lactis TaxID=1358 RepID=UPI0028916A70|nr:hypothetical protein [Lactococcus lactis]MDT2939200.1 hypothetical protein [Lactococcus lactis]